MRSTQPGAAVGRSPPPLGCSLATCWYFSDLLTVDRDPDIDWQLLPYSRVPAECSQWLWDCPNLFWQATDRIRRGYPSIHPFIMLTCSFALSFWLSTHASIFACLHWCILCRENLYWRLYQKLECNIFNRNNLLAVVWFQVFRSNTNQQKRLFQWNKYITDDTSNVILKIYFAKCIFDETSDSIYPSRLGLLNTPTASLQRGKIPPLSDTK